MKRYSLNAPQIRMLFKAFQRAKGSRKERIRKELILLLGLYFQKVQFNLTHSDEAKDNQAKP